MNLPSEKELAIAILETPLSKVQREKILKNLRYMSEAKIAELYKYLLDLKLLEAEVRQQAEAIDSRYRLKFESEIEKQVTSI